MKRVLSTCIIVCLGLLFHGCFSLLSAGHVTLEISTTTGLERDTIAADFRITNRGTDTAQEVSVTGKFLEEQQRAFIADRIKPGQSAEVDKYFNLLVSI